MNPIQQRIIIMVSLFLLTLVSGVWLSNAGKPLNTAIFTVHKLIALGIAISTAVSIYQVRNDVTINAISMISMIVTGLLLIAMFATGALLSINQQIGGITLLSHRIIPLLLLLFSSLSFYFISSK
jgi:hypothetical protein